MGGFYASTDSVILNMAGDAYIQIILRRPILAIMGFKINVKGARLTFDVELGLVKDHESSPSSFPCCGYDLVVSSENVESFHVSQ